MEKFDTHEIELAFNDLIAELEKVKYLNDIAETHKGNTELLSQKLREYYDFSKAKDISLANTLNGYVEKITIIQHEIERQLVLLKDKISELTDSNLKVVASVEKSSTNIDLVLTSQTEMLDALKKQETNFAEVVSILMKLKDSHHEDFATLQEKMEEKEQNARQQVQGLSEQIEAIKKGSITNRILTVTVMALVIILLVLNIIG